MEPLVALGLANNVVQFFDFGSKLCARIKEFSSTAGKAPGEIGELADRLSLTLSPLKTLDQEGLKTVESDQKTLEACTNHVEELDNMLAKFTVTQTKEGISQWQKGAKKVERSWKAFKSLRGDDKIEDFQKNLDRLLSLVSLQL